MLSNKSPLVSVVIPAYNHEKFVQETIHSIIKQTYQNIELIIIDDGSKDTTWNKINELKKKCEERFTRVHFETQENQGTCNTLNKLISLTKGDYVYFIASDDIAKPQAIEKQIIAITKNNAIVAVGDNEIVDHNSIRIGWDKKRNNCDLKYAYYKTFGAFLKLKEKKSDFGTYAQLLRGNHIPNGCLIEKKTLLQIPRFTPSAPLEDYFMHLQLSKIGKYCFLNEVLFSYRWHENNTIKQAEKMKIASDKTLKYEENLVSKLPNKKWEKIFKKEKYKTIILFSLGKIIKLYKKRELFTKKTILEIFGYQILLKKK
ncbi:MAG: glycosyltransferase family 2 protein [Alphaproteobacteria bacterium]|nr:glycosyltransferase family 2 protein [Alphaproteobacteria bacterium]